MNYDGIENDISQMVNEELIAAREKFRNMSSSHEGYAVILEEIEELKQNVVELSGANIFFWEHIKKGDYEAQTLSILDMRCLATETIKEAIQVAAMLRRFREDVLQIPDEKEGEKA